MTGRLRSLLAVFACTLVTVDAFTFTGAQVEAAVTTCATNFKPRFDLVKAYCSLIQTNANGYDNLSQAQKDNLICFINFVIFQLGESLSPVADPTAFAIFLSDYTTTANKAMIDLFVQHFLKKLCESVSTDVQVFKLPKFVPAVTTAAKQTAEEEEFTCSSSGPSSAPSSPDGKGGGKSSSDEEAPKRVQLSFNKPGRKRARSNAGNDDKNKKAKGNN